MPRRSNGNPGRKRIHLPRQLSKWGLCSRREAEQAVVDGRVRVNGRVERDVLFGVDPETDRIELDGVDAAARPKIYLALHKPRGVVTTRHDPEGRRTVMDLVPSRHRGAMPVGRLDRDTSGLLLLTNDHDFADLVCGDRSRIEKVYHAVVRGRITEDNLEPIRRGLSIDAETQFGPAAARVLRTRGATTRLEIVLNEGKNRQIRKTLQALGIKLRTLRRVAIGGLALGDLAPGETRAFTADEVTRHSTRNSRPFDAE